MAQAADVKNVYREWLRDPLLSTELRQELESIAHNEAEIEDRFYKELEFGTGGMRGVMGAGTNRMNRLTVGKAVQGLAQMLQEENAADPSVVIAYDSRHQSDQFAIDAASVLGANGIKAYVFESLRPTPELSFAVRYLNASAGIMITASHNPPEYNGLKVYGNDGGQLTPDAAERLISHIRAVQSFRDIKTKPVQTLESEGLFISIGEQVDRAFIDAVVRVSPRPELVKSNGDKLYIIYTPLHGTGNVPVREALKTAGFTNVEVVSEQERPDGAFPTVKSPNPEEREALQLALAQAERAGADIVIGTDPDCDRMGVLVKNKNGEFVSLSGSEAGALMLSYLLESLKETGQLPENGAMIKTIVTGELGAVIAQSYGLNVYNTLTGFKYIGEKMTEFEKTNESTYLFGYEESYGYLAGTHARDKDGVVAAMLIAEAALYGKLQGKTLPDLLEELFAKHGTFLEETHSRTLKGKSGIEQMQTMMNAWRSSPRKEIGGVKVVSVLDYLNGVEGFPKENVLKYMLEDDSWVALRPSGTEPKMKIYFAVRKSSRTDAAEAMERLKASVFESLMEQ